MTKKKRIILISSIASGVVVLSVTFGTLGGLVFNRISRGITPTDADLQYVKDNHYVYDHVVVFGVDGAGGFIKDVDTPNFDRIFDGGSITYDGLAQYKTESAQNWGSMIHGVRSCKHGLDNDLAGKQKYTDTKYPSYFKVYGERHPDTYMVAINDWETVNYGIIEDNIPGMKKMNGGDYASQETKSKFWVEAEREIDQRVSELVIDEIDNDPKLIFMHFDAVDSAGHTYGSKSEQYRESIRYIDGLMGNIYDAMVNDGWKENTLFICVTDHGHKPDGGHGFNSRAVRYVTCAVNGHKGNVIAGEMGYYVTQDMAPIVLYALGEKQPESWDGSVPKNIFKGLKG